jgi:hypothetical protein
METNDKEQCQNLYLRGFGLQIVAGGSVMANTYLFFFPKFVIVLVVKDFNSFFTF